MASHSPIVLDSSSPSHHSRSLCNTPPPTCYNDNTAEDNSSSPRLADAYSFYTKPLVGSKNKSQQPRVASTSFTRNATIPKSHKMAGDALSRLNEKYKKYGNQNGAGRGASRWNTSMSALSKPVGDHMNLSSEEQNDTDMQLAENANHTNIYETSVVPKTFQHCTRFSPMMGNDGYSQAERAEQDTVIVSAYAFSATDETCAKLPTRRSIPIKRRRHLQLNNATEDQDEASKNPTKQSTKTGKAPAKKRKKRFTKSESIVIESDEMDACLELPTTCGSPNRSIFSAAIHTVDLDKGTNTFSDQYNKVTKKQAESEPVDEDVSCHGCSTTSEPMGDDQSHVAAALTSHTEPTAARESLAPLIMGITYTEPPLCTASPQRIATGEAATKRCRIDLADASIVGLEAQNPPNMLFSEPLKKTKAPKKKPQTITALATKAYLAPNNAEGAALSPCQPIPHGGQEIPTLSETTLSAYTKQKKSRKPRIRKLDGDGGQLKSNKTPRTRGVKKAKVRTDKTKCLNPLCSPQEARQHERVQSFLFGTSSQLATESSPRYIREIREALQESETKSVKEGLTWSAQCEAKAIATRPLVNFSIGQGARELWCSAARNHEGDVLTVEGKALTLTDAIEPVQTGAATLAEETLVVSTRSANLPPVAKIKDNPPSEQDPEELAPIDSDGSGHERTGEGNVADLCQNSPAMDKEGSYIPHNSTPPPPMTLGDLRASQDCDAAHWPSDDDSWMLLGSDDSMTLKPYKTPEITYACSQTSRGLFTTSPKRQRKALQALDSNASLMIKNHPFRASPAQQQCVVHTVASGPSATIGDDKSNGPGIRVRKPVNKTTKRREMPKDISSVPDDACTKVDEISDSDTPVTPSPPRRRPHFSPTMVQPLDFCATQLRSENPTTSAPSIKISDSDWSEIAADLFPRITAVIRSTPSSTELSNPTWHEKILLFDPIVLEDLTCWLNKHDIKIKVRQLKPIAKRKGKKSKDLIREDPQYETRIEELKPWMVQRWCRENSICCLWKQGLRGGVRTRY